MLNCALAGCAASECFSFQPCVAGECHLTRVLVVDDQASFLRSLCRLLSRAGFCVVGEAASISEAEVLARTCAPDLAVVDLILPGVDGMEGIRRLRAVRPTLRVILISVIDNHVDLIRAAAVHAGAEDFVPKEELSLQLVRSWNE